LFFKGVWSGDDVAGSIARRRIVVGCTKIMRREAMSHYNGASRLLDNERNSLLFNKL
jgi:hypothetical protein